MASVHPAKITAPASHGKARSWDMVIACTAAPQNSSSSPPALSTELISPVPSLGAGQTPTRRTDTRQSTRSKATRRPGEPGSGETTATPAEQRALRLHTHHVRRWAA